jgi:hypothetical protein
LFLVDSSPLERVLLTIFHIYWALKFYKFV